MRPMPIILALAALGAQASAAERNDALRAGLSAGVAQDPSIAFAGGDRYEVDATHVRLSLGWLRDVRALDAGGAIIAGAAVFIETSNGDAHMGSSGADVDTRAIGVLVEVGYARSLPALPALRLEGALQLGYLHQDVELIQGAEFDIAQRGIEYGIRATGLYDLDERWEAGVDLRWLIDSSTDGMLNGSESTYENDGLAVGVVLGYRL